MRNRISLYFEPYAWERLNRYLSYLLLSGKPFYELPTMNDLIEDAVVYVAKHMTGVAITGTDLMPYITGTGALPIKDTLSGRAYEKGRIAFNLTPRGEKALKQIRETNKEIVNSIHDELIPEGTSDPVLIRSCAYYLIADSSTYFFADLYFTFLFDLGTSMLPLNLSISDEEINAMTELEKNNLRKVSWDEGLIAYLRRSMALVLLQRETKVIPVSEMPEKTLRGNDYQSHGFSFNYIQAFIGFVAVQVGKSHDLSLPEILRGFSIHENDISAFIQCLLTIQRYSRSLILGSVKEMETEEKNLSLFR